MQALGTFFYRAPPLAASEAKSTSVGIESTIIHKMFETGYSISVFQEIFTDKIFISEGRLALGNNSMRFRDFSDIS